MMKKISIALAVLATAAAAWFTASPWWTLRAMREAARDRDSAALSAYVDYEALRTDLKGDLRRSMMAEMRAQPGGVDAMGPLASIGMAVAMGLIDPMVESAVSPEGVEAVFAGQRANEGAGVAASAAPGTPPAPRRTPSTGPSLAGAAPGDDPVIERVSLDEFRVRGADTDGALIFRRHGLGWKLSAVDLPVG